MSGSNHPYGPFSYNQNNPPPRLLGRDQDELVSHYTGLRHGCNFGALCSAMQEASSNIPFQYNLRIRIDRRRTGAANPMTDLPERVCECVGVLDLDP